MPRHKNPDTVAKNTAYRNEYSKQHYDRLNLLLPKGAKKIIQNAARAKAEAEKKTVEKTAKKAA